MINVLNRLQTDLMLYGTCTMTIVDTTDLFVIERHDPLDWEAPDYQFKMNRAEIY